MSRKPCQPPFKNKKKSFNCSDACGILIESGSWEGDCWETPSEIVPNEFMEILYLYLSEKFPNIYSYNKEKNEIKRTKL